MNYKSQINSLTSKFPTSHVLCGEVHDLVEPLPEGKVALGQRLPTKLGPGDDQVLHVVPTEVGVSTKDNDHYDHQDRTIDNQS